MAQDQKAEDRRPRLLVVEDDAATRTLIARRLGDMGYAITAVDAAEEAIVEVAETHFDAVITDIHLPGLSGIELAGFLLSQEPGLPLILMTGDRDETLARQALERWPVSYLLKPVEPIEIASMVRQSLVRRGWRVREDGTLAAALADSSGAGFVPDEWLDFVEHESFAGPGHGERVARIALTLLEEIEPESRDITPTELALGARTHEVGRLPSPDAEPPAVAVQGAELMTEARFPRPTVRAVRHMYERWDGAGGPDGLGESNIPLGARVLAVADSVDHYVSAWLQAGLNGDNAADRAMHLVTVQQGQAFGPDVVRALHRRTEDVRGICTAGREQVSSESLTTAAFAANLAEAPFRVA